MASVEYLAIGGGGGGAGQWGGGGGAGAVAPGSTPISGPFSHSVTIGAGGRGGYLGNDPANQGRMVMIQYLEVLFSSKVVAVVVVVVLLSLHQILMVDLAVVLLVDHLRVVVVEHMVTLVEVLMEQHWW